MKPDDEKDQSAMVLSPETTNIGKADSFHLLEGRIKHIAMAIYVLLSRGLRPWNDSARILLEPGRSYRWYRGSCFQSEEERKQ